MTDSTARHERVAVGRFRPSPYQTRIWMDPDALRDLSESIQASGGLIQPIVARFKPDEDTGTDMEIVAGERRWRACMMAGCFPEVDTLVRELTDEEAEAIVIMENHDRENVSAAEEARGAKRLLFRNRGDKDETARQLGWSVHLLECRLALTACTEAVQLALAKRQIQIGHAELLAGVPPATQDKVLAGIIEHKVAVNVIKAQLGQFARKLSSAIFDTAQCVGCAHNSAQQAHLFSESLGEGYCQHPTHFDELTMAVLEAKAAALREEVPVVRIVKPQDGFEPLSVGADGELGVGTEQYAACQGCKDFGCSVSAMPGSCGEVTKSLCFNADCHTRMIAARRKAEKAAQKPGNEPAGKAAAATSGKAATPKASTTSHVTQRLADYREKQWRKWLANVVMSKPERNHKVLIAVAMAGRGSVLNSEHYKNAVDKLTTRKPAAGIGLRGALQLADEVDQLQLSSLVNAVAACSAFGVDKQELETLLNYFDVDEAQFFTLNEEFLDLFTKSELEVLADELKLKKAMGERFKGLRDGKRDAFIKGLLGIAGVDYRGMVPKAMRYPRKKFAQAASSASGEGGEGDSAATESAAVA